MPAYAARRCFAYLGAFYNVLRLAAYALLICLRCAHIALARISPQQ